ncbi:helix-turn-helix domain-containing protein [Actinomadura sp. 6N118]|uniref:helix-turn-helix domain-containing protein n=1 Tax=Actinomadura sp. 6N118 TaxID=3375151 RepID=UPI0037967A27
MGGATSAGKVCVACRETVLSRYNPEPLCAGCQQAARDGSGIAPAWLWDSWPMRQALARADVAAVVALLRAASGLSQDDLGLLVGWSQATVSLTERGQRATLYDVRELLGFVDAVGMPREALAPLFLGDSHATLREDNEALDSLGEMDLERRDFNAMAAGLMASALVPQVTVPDRVERAHVRYLQAIVDRLRVRDQSMGGGAVLKQALAEFARARRMLDQADYSEAVGRQLLIATADLGIICGWVAYDHGNQPLTRRLYNEAQLLASSSGDADLQTHVLLNMSMQSTYLAGLAAERGEALGFAREGLRLAVQAGDVARHEPSRRLHALVALRQAAAYSHLGDAAGFRACITLARRELDRGPHPTDAAWTGFVTPGEVAAYRSAGYLRLGDAAQAVRLQQAALEDAGLSPRNRACAQASLAKVLLVAGDRTEAINTGKAVLPALREMTSARPLASLSGVRTAAAKAGDDEFCTHYDTAARALAT